MTSPETVRAGIYGVLVGDALGVPYEFMRRRGHRRGGMVRANPSGQAGHLERRWLAHPRPRRLPHQRRLRHRRPGPPLPGLGRYRRLHAARRGPIRHRACHGRRFRAPAPGRARRRGGRQSGRQGNGPLTRIPPIALVDPADDAAELIDRAHRSSAITHGAPECMAACAVYVLVARRLADGERDRPSALAVRLRRCRGRLPPPRGSGTPRRAGAPAGPCRAKGPRLGDRLVLECVGRLRGARDLPDTPSSPR